MMGDHNGANGDGQLPMDYFDFDLSSFGMDGGLAATGISLQAVPEADENPRMITQDRMLETTSHSTPADAGTIWANTVDHQNGNSARDMPQHAIAPKGEMLHEQVSSLSSQTEFLASHLSSNDISVLHEQLAQFHMQSPAIFAQFNGQQSIQSALPVAFAGKQGDVNNAINDGRMRKPVSFGTYGMRENSAKGLGATGHPHPHAMPTPGEPLHEHF